MGELRKYNKSCGSALTTAFLEWLLIFMLLVYAVFGYIITTFAKYCELPIPCLLCSRIDHILGSEKFGYYRDLICGDHMLEVSSLVFCHFHDKLVDVRHMCENCLFSFATKGKSNAETYRLLVGKLGAEDLDDLDEYPLGDDRNPSNSNVKRCSCCNELWVSKCRARKFLETDLDVPLNYEVREYVDDLDREDKSLYHSEAMIHLRGVMEDSSHVLGYTKVKITSDTESEIHVSDNEETTALISSDPLRDLILDSVPIQHFISVSEDDNVLSVESSEVLCQVQSDIVESCEVPSTTSSRVIGHGLEELNWQAIDVKRDQSEPAELINFDHVPETLNDGNISNVISNDGPDIIEAEITQTLAQKETDKSQNLDACQMTSDTNCSKINSDLKSNDNDNGLQIPSDLDLGGAYTLAVSNKGGPLSNKLAEQLSGKDSPQVSGDLKLLLSQLSRGLDFSSNDILSPRVSRNLDELKSQDSSTSIGIKLLQKRLSLERNDSRSSLDRNESGFESLENFSTISEIEGETEVDRLKRQLEHDRKVMLVLLKELEEERNASAISANEAMAMITRVQEEKAALQMEALQDIRMMEEQAEYDMEALEKLNEIVTEKDKDIQDLEAEVEYFHTKYPNESLLEDNSKDSWLEVGDERDYILQRLSSLEKKLHNMDGNQRGSSYESKLYEESDQVKSELDENNVSKRSPRIFVRRVPSLKNPKLEGSLIYKEDDIVALGDELLNLNDKLQALEADRNFLERVISTLKNGDDKLIQEIASHLRELRKSGIRRDQAFS